ncbi:MAG: methylated-DNA--[protein]-cysteine S-methyltransferase [Pseudomonadota bacterium]
MRQAAIDTPVGMITVTEEDGVIKRTEWGRPQHPGSAPVLSKAIAEITAYFEGKTKEFTVPLSKPTSQFAAEFRDALLAIRFGDTLTYGDIAQQLGVSAQAIGQACGANPIPVIVPCHRVLGANGLGGFSGGTGIETKVALLRHEGAAGLLI